MPGKRVATALVLLALVLPAVFTSDPRAWAGLTLLFLVVAAWEWGRLLASARAAAALAVVTAGTGAVLFARLPQPGWPAALVGGACAAAILLWLVLGSWRLRAGRARCAAQWADLALAFVWLLACWLALVELHAFGPAALLVAMSVVWIADISAYFCGRAFGRHRLAPSISPGKTREGALGALALTALAGWGAAWVPALAGTLPARMVAGWGSPACVLVLMILVVLSIVGDLHESLLKRQAGVKDSGALLPGHGGVLDRIDALIPVMPAAVLLHYALG